MRRDAFWAVIDIAETPLGFLSSPEGPPLDLKLALANGPGVFSAYLKRPGRQSATARDRLRKPKEPFCLGGGDRSICPKAVISWLRYGACAASIYASGRLRLGSPWAVLLFPVLSH
jgi:hypothetical protein